MIAQDGKKNNLPWPERVTMLSINPEAGRTSDVERLAGEWIILTNFIFGILSNLPHEMKEKIADVFDEYPKTIFPNIS